MKKVYLFATVMALITGCTVYIYATNLQASTITDNTPTISVVVAMNDINTNTVITEGMVQIKELPSVSVTPGTATSVAEVIGKIVKYPILSGEQIVTKKLKVVGDETGTDLSYQLTDNERAMTVSVDEITGVSGFIRAGDRVDIITTETTNNTPKTYYLLENVEVLKVSNKAANVAGTEITQYNTVTLCLSPENSLVLGEAITLGKSIRLVLRPTTEN